MLKVLKYKMKQNELIEDLKKAVKDRDNEAVHGIYDSLIKLRLNQHEPSFIKKLNKLVEGIDFWYA